jgi:glyoxalase family protein
MVADSPGIHHVTGLAGPAQANVDFYAGALGLRLVKRTVNQEDSLTPHLLYGNRAGDPGTVFTSFPDPNDDPGRLGKPQIAAVAFAVPPGSLDYWRDRFDEPDTPVEARSRLVRTCSAPRTRTGRAWNWSKPSRRSPRGPRAVSPPSTRCAGFTA